MPCDEETLPLWLLRRLLRELLSFLHVPFTAVEAIQKVPCDEETLPPWKTAVIFGLCC